MPPLTNEVLAMIVTAMATLSGLLAAGWYLRGTTLRPASIWMIAAVVAVAWVGVVQASEPPEVGGKHPLAYLAAVMTLCPTIAALGAKRPQHTAWQFIVVTLLAILAMPAAEAWLFLGGRLPELHVARQGMMIALVVMGFANYLPTPFAPAAALWSLATLVWLAPFVPWLGDLGLARSTVTGMTAAAGGVIAGWMAIALQSKPTNSLDAAWLDFRNMYGVLWSLRVAERFNTTAIANQWPIELQWRGIVFKSEREMTSEQRRDSQQLLESLLRRFVNREWLTRRQQTHDEGPATTLQ